MTTAPLHPDDVLRQVRDVMAAASTAGTGFPDTPEGNAFTRAQWVVRVMEALYDEVKFAIGDRDESDSLGQVLNAAHGHEDRQRDRMRPPTAPLPARKEEPEVLELELVPGRDLGSQLDDPDEELRRVQRLQAAAFPATGAVRRPTDADLTRPAHLLRQATQRRERDRGQGR